MDSQDTIIIKAPAGTKARWVRQSQRAGQKLGDWIVNQMEASMRPKITPIIIPADVSFADLKMARDPQTGDVSFAWPPIEQICEASGLGLAALRQSEDGVAELLTAWYRHHLAIGGAPDPVYVDLIGEVNMEDAHGHGLSHQPGRA